MKPDENILKLIFHYYLRVYSRQTINKVLFTAYNFAIKKYDTVKMLFFIDNLKEGSEGVQKEKSKCFHEVACLDIKPN